MNQESLQKNLKPFVKWAGGKTQLLDIINLLLPRSYNRLIEPFTGGGAFFLNKRESRLLINDINKELITTYLLIKKSPHELMRLLREYEKNHSKEFYEVLKKQNISELTELGIAARFIYLNKTCFNGLYRVNSKGEFNVPWNQKEKVKLFDKENILAISEYLNSNNCQIFNIDYKDLLNDIQPGDFLFVDPPYDNEDDKGFTNYSIGGFNKSNQKELFNFLKEAEKKGVKWLLTNHNTCFIRDLYKEYSSFTKKVNRFINSQGSKRVGSVKEIFVWNYELTSEQKEELRFEEYFDGISHTNISLESLVDLDKVERNIEIYKEDLNELGSLLGNREGLNYRIENLWATSPQSFQALPVLLAIKDSNFSWIDNNEVKFWESDDLKLDEIKEFIFNSNLLDLFTNGQVKNLKDYAWGLEIGLDTHGRKNRSGKLMEKTVEKLLVNYNIDYQSQKSVFLGGDKKVFDFWLKINDKEYYCETNFFNSQGSKLSEVIRSYSHLYQLSEKEKINFLWIGDGRGLRSVKDSLKKLFFSTNNFLFTISSFEEWIKKDIDN